MSSPTTPSQPVDPGLVALGVTLLLASLVPLTGGHAVRAAALAYLGAVAWGLGTHATLGTLVLSGAGMTVLAAGAALGIHTVRRLSAPRTAGR